MYQIFRYCQCLNDLQVRIYDLATSTTWHSNGVPQMYSSWNGIKISQILSLLFDPLLIYAVNVLKIKYWRTYILARFALTAYIVKIM